MTTNYKELYEKIAKEVIEKNKGKMNLFEIAAEIQKECEAAREELAKGVSK